MTSDFADDLVARLQGLKPDGLYREEQVIASPQQGEVRLEGGAACINLCANNYLGACAAERFRMDGCIADLPAICDLAERYDAMVTFDDSHAVGFVGASVRGTHVPRRAGRAAPWYRPDLCTPLAHAEELQVLRTKNARQ